MDRPWGERAWVELRRLASSGRPFTADDLLAAVGHPDEGHGPNGRNNSVGSLFGRAHRARLIEPVGTAQSRQPHRKGGLVRVWQGREEPTLFALDEPEA